MARLVPHNGEVLWTRPLAALIAASLVSSMGSLMSAVALPWFVLQTTGSPSRMGFVLAAESAALLLLAVPSERAVRRLGARRTMLVADGVRCLLVAAVPVLHLIGSLSFPLLVVLAFLAGIPWAAHSGSETAMVPALVGRDARRIEQATGVLQALMRLAYFAGPLLGGVLVAAVGAPGVLFVDAASFAVAFALVLVWVPAKANARKEAEGSAIGGWRYLRRDRWLGPVTAASTLSQAAFMGMTATIPVLAFRDFGNDSAVAGALLGVWGGGAMVGALLSLRLVHRVEPFRLASGAWMLMAAPLWTLALAPPALLAGVALALSGLGNGIRNPPIAGMTARRVPESLLAETMTAATSIVLGGGFLALLGAGFLLGRLDVSVVWAGVAGLQTIAVGIFCWAAERPTGTDAAAEGG